MHQIIRRGDYLEIQFIQKQAPIQTKKKPEEQNTGIYSQTITTQQAIQRYKIPIKLQKHNNRYIYLNQQLRELEKQLSRSADGAQDLKETKRLLIELKNLQTVQQIKVIDQPFLKAQEKVLEQKAPIQYKLVLPIKTNLEERIKILENIEYPKLKKIEQLVSILIGQQTITSEKSKMNLKNENINNIFNRYQKNESTINQFPNLVDRIYQSQKLHSETVHFVDKLKQLTTIHHEISEQLNDNLKLSEKLQKNFKQNKQRLKKTLEGYKKRVSKLKQKKLI